MKKAALVAAALAMVLSLAACGNRDNDTSKDPATGNGTTQNGGSVNNGGTNDNNGGVNNNGTNGTNGNNSGINDNNNGVNNNGAGVGAGNGTGTGSMTGSDTGMGTGNGAGASTGTGAGTGTGTASGSAAGRSTVGNDLRRAADDVGDAVTGMVDGTRSAVARGTSTTTFQRMLDNARVHDVDGVLADGENSRW